MFGLKIGRTKTNVEGMIGQVGVVIKEMEAFKTGQIKVKGQIWTAKEIEGRSLSEGTKVEVMEVEGVKLIVRSLEE